MSQQELGKEKGVSLTIIGNYEIDLNMPSLETVLKLSKLFGVSVDFLMGEFDKEVVRRIEDIEILDKGTQNHLFFLIDNVIQNYKIRQAFA
ncbi:helix-turn-helix domain-containing protein [Aureibacter tunicatorum]|nr:helix-turn-helix transcriptional regulator [Aureibacter tunicatorum]